MNNDEIIKILAEMCEQIYQIKDILELMNRKFDENEPLNE